jgi:hypothetical protein
VLLSAKATQHALLSSSALSMVLISASSTLCQLLQSLLKPTLSRTTLPANRSHLLFPLHPTLVDLLAVVVLSQPELQLRSQLQSEPTPIPSTLSPSPIAEPVVDDLSACLAACKGNPACIAYTFESGVCKLFGSTAVRRQAAGTHANPVNSAPAGSPTPIAEPAVNSLAACLAACKGNPSCIAYTFESGVCKLFGPTTSAKVAQSPSTVSSSTGTHANPTNAIPAGSPTPIATPVVTDLTACLGACKANPACIAYVFESGVCKLFD